ncbi:MAG: lycopene cyclase domain-containing protein [Ferruginibacter sp.]
MNSHYTYFIILAASLAGPLALSFDKKVAFFKKWKFLFPAMILPALFYIVWDSLFTSLGVWSFNPNYVTGIHILNLPLEEVLFFFVVPYCCMFIYECIVCYFPSITNGVAADVFLKLISALLLIIGVFFYHRYYTASTFILFALFPGAFYLFKKHIPRFKTIYFLLSFAIILIPFLLVNGFLTAIPVVLYNDAENLGFRIYTIPFEDTFYGMLLFFMNLVIYENLRRGIKQI